MEPLLYGNHTFELMIDFKFNTFMCSVYAITFKYENPASGYFYYWIGFMIEFNIVTYLCFLYIQLHVNGKPALGEYPTLGLMIEFSM